MRIDGKRASSFSTQELQLMWWTTLSPSGEFLTHKQCDEVHKVLTLREAKEEEN